MKKYKLLLLLCEFFHMAKPKVSYSDFSSKSDLNKRLEVD